MNKPFVTVLLALCGVGISSLAQSNTPTNQKTIKDQAEYNAYVTAMNTTDSTARGVAMEAFAKQYPASVVLLDALEQAMQAYQQAGEATGMRAMARQILKAEPNHLPALAIVTELDRNAATAGGPAGATALKNTCDHSQRGLHELPSFTKSDNVTDAEFQTQRDHMSAVFNGAAGFCALQAKSYDAAKGYYLKSVASDPTSSTDFFQLAVAEMEKKPIDVSGFWHCSRAMKLAKEQDNPKAEQAIGGYCKDKYRSYHGSENGWGELMAQASTEDVLPAGFAARVKPGAEKPAVKKNAIR